MKVTTVERKISLAFTLSTSHGPATLVVDIGVNNVIFRSGGCRTDCTFEQAENYPREIQLCIRALIGNVYQSELDACVAELNKIIGAL